MTSTTIVIGINDEVDSLSTAHSGTAGPNRPLSITVPLMHVLIINITVTTKGTVE
eukprot:gnl/Chilomastix_caulleri/4771.p4 GENE.gnl/Chilomastix_caulleri/4771~~gnl/Chilomastix_caulleri/4771.p4  ORF type:complete len:55 (+),score=1.26 gnl/Chilomastix_caulleri/4771:261-425(+)